MSVEEDFTKAAALFSAADYQAALRAYVDIVAVAGAATAVRVRALNNISACHASLKRYEESKTAAEAVVALDPHNAKAHGRIAAAAENLGQYTTAGQHYAKAASCAPGTPTYSSGAARCRLLAATQCPGVPDKAEKEAYYYAKSLERASAAARDASYLEAIRHFSKALDLFPASGTSRDKATLLCNRSAAYFRAERVEESAEDALAAVKADDTYARAFFRLGAAKAKLKMAGDAYDALKVCVGLDPAHVDAAQLLGEVLPTALEERKTAAERARDRDVARALAAMELAQSSATATAAASVPRATAHGSGYAYCNFCNEVGHVRGECPLLRRKRGRPM